MQIPKTPRLRTSKFYRIPKFYFKTKQNPSNSKKFIYNIPNKNLPFPRLEDIGYSFDFSPKNRDASSAIYKYKIIIRNFNSKTKPRKTLSKYGD